MIFFWYFFITGIVTPLIPIIHLLLTRNGLLMEFWFQFYFIGVIFVGIWIGCMIGISYERPIDKEVSHG